MGRIVLPILFIALTQIGFSQRGAVVKPENLESLSARADRIVHGNILSARVEPHPRYRNLSTVVVKMRVQDVLKGNADKEITFRQFVWDFRDKFDAAGYRKGQELVLFLNKVNEEGLSSSTGVDQGRMEVVHEPDGKAYVQPHSDSKILLAGVETALTAKGKKMPASMRAALEGRSSKIELNDLKQVLSAFNEVKKIR